MRVTILLVLFMGTALAQENRSLLNVRQIMKDALDIIRNAPPLPVFKEVSKHILSTTQVSPVKQYTVTKAPQPVPLTYEQIQMLRHQAAAQPLVNSQQMTPQKQIQKLKELEHQYQLTKMPQQRGSQANYDQVSRYGPVPQQTSQQPQLNLNPHSLTRIFATPTEKDVERLLKLPTEILYKMAKEGQYIESRPNNNQYHDTHSSEYDRSSRSESSGVGSDAVDGAPDAVGGLFGDGFSFNLEKSGNNMETPVASVKKPENTILKSLQTTTQSASGFSTVLSVVENATIDTIPKFTFNESKVSKPYFTYRTYENPANDHWELIVPNSDNKPAIRVPMAEVLRLSKIVAKASHQAGISVGSPKAELEELGQLHLDLFPTPVTKAPLITVVTTQAGSEMPPKHEQLSSASAFVQESEFPKVQKIDENPSRSTRWNNLYAEQEIILNGKRYKLIDDDGNVNPGVLAAATKEEELKQQIVAPSPPLSPMIIQNQPQLPALMASQQQEPELSVYSKFTPEQRNILLEMQQRLLRQEISRRQLELHQAIASAQPGVYPEAQAAPNFVMTEPPAAFSSADPNQSYFGKVQAPVEFEQQYVKQQINNIQSYQQPQQQQHAMAVIKTPVQIVKPQTSTETVPQVLPMKKQYSLAELEEFYKLSNTNSQAKTTSFSLIEVTTTAESPHVYTPRKQIKIGVNNSQTDPTSLDVSETKIVDATADAADQEKQRVAELRRQFAVERGHLNRLRKSKIERTTSIDATTSSSPLITEQHCYNIQNFSKQNGYQNIFEYAKIHCHFIENYYPQLKCDNVVDYMQVCQQYYSSRRLLFTA